jgi:hypothetical protein
MTWHRIRPWVEDVFAAACWLALFAGGTLLLVGLGA